jgi:putative ABC transport system ATP-binding protein
MSHGNDPMVEGMNIIRAESVTKTYVTGTVTVAALRGINIEIRKGEMVAVMGPSGCGKTTLLNCLSGIDEVTSGKIFIEGQDLTAMKDRDKTSFRAHRMGFVFQLYNLLPILTAAENVEFPLLVAGANPKESRKRAVDLLNAVGLSDKTGMRPSALSGGERQRVTIARALANSPAIVWADEPTGDLDHKNSEEVVGLMRRLNQENGQTFVVVTHDQGVGAKCDRIIHMRDGNIVNNDDNLESISKEIERLGSNNG